MIGKMPRDEIAERLGVSVSSLKRAFRGTRLAFHNYCTANPELVRAVNQYYETHNINDTAKAFGLMPKQVDYIVYRYKMHKPKQLRWTDEQVIESAKMSGLVSFKAQARFFNRPGAFEGSIKALWQKKFKVPPGGINGMPHWKAREIVSADVPYIRPVGMSRDGKLVRFRRIALWVDMEKYLLPDVPQFIREAIMTMARFQRWLWKSYDPKPLILQMIKQREEPMRQETIEKCEKVQAMIDAGTRPKEAIERSGIANASYYKWKKATNKAASKVFAKINSEPVTKPAGKLVCIIGSADEISSVIRGMN